ncbi:DUF952 domain-containing protein [Spirosoma areae]
MNLLYHIVPASDWVEQEKKSTYTAASLGSEGFIHLSEKEQVAGVLDRYYQGITNLLILHIDSTRLAHELRYEASATNELFPHLYGPLNKEAVVNIERLT